jgi:hypothetical protein
MDMPTTQNSMITALDKSRVNFLSLIVHNKNIIIIFKLQIKAISVPLAKNSSAQREL